MKKKSTLSKVIFILLVIIIIVARYAPNPNGNNIHSYKKNPSLQTYEEQQPNYKKLPNYDYSKGDPFDEIIARENRKHKSSKSSKSITDDYNDHIDAINAKWKAHSDDFKEKAQTNFYVK